MNNCKPYKQMIIVYVIYFYHILEMYCIDNLVFNCLGKDIKKQVNISKYNLFAYVNIFSSNFIIKLD